MFSTDIYYTVLCLMVVLAVVVFFTLRRITAGYGMMYSSKWGPAVGNRLGWVLMETPSVVGMLLLWLFSPRADQPALIVMASLFLIHYCQRSFLFPMLMRGKSRMPVAVMLCGIIFNLLNCYMIGGWLFYMAPESAYPDSWLWNPLFLLGTVVFLVGMAINLQSDSIIRHLRRPGDTAHYIPRGGCYRYVTCANYFGEFVEWTGYAILTWSLPGAVFALWTFANLAPRARAITKRYNEEFGDAYTSLRRRHMIPFIY